jgi:glyoxylate reductase
MIKPFSAVLSTIADYMISHVLGVAPHLKCVANFVVGYNNIDLKAAQTKRIWVTNTPNVLTKATADLAWALLLSCARHVPEGERMVRSGKFERAHQRS